MPFNWKQKSDLFRGEGIYHLTFVVQNRIPLLGNLQPHPQAEATGHLSLVAATALGCTVSQLFSALPARHPEMQILAKQIMPDHFHAVVWMHQGFQGSIKMVARGFSQACSKAARQQVQHNLPSSPSTTSPQSPTTNFPQSPSTTSPSSPSPSIQAQSNCAPNDSAIHPNVPALPAASYDCGNGANTLFATPYIRTLSHAGQLQSMISYVHANPDNAWLRRLHPDLYVIHRNVTYAGLSFDAMGKSHLLDWPDRQVIRLSRSLTEDQIQYEVSHALYLAQSGTVTYTAAMNTAEKAVSHAIRTNFCPLVVLLLDGFPPEGTESARHYHPQGVYHQACGAGLLFLLSPSSSNYDDPRLISLTEQELQHKAQSKGYHYTPIPHTSKRWRMIAGNMMLRMLAGEA